MIDNADIITGFKTYPHIDMYESGFLCGNILKKMLDGKATPHLVWRQLPMITHSLMRATDSPAMTAAIDHTKILVKRDDIYAVTVMAGFALADNDDPVLSVMVVVRNEKVGNKNA